MTNIYLYIDSGLHELMLKHWQINSKVLRTVKYKGLFLFRMKFYCSGFNHIRESMIITREAQFKEDIYYYKDKVTVAIILI